MFIMPHKALECGLGSGEEAGEIKKIVNTCLHAGEEQKNESTTVAPTKKTPEEESEEVVSK